MHPDFMCMLWMDTPTCLHGSLFPTDRSVAATQLPLYLHTARVIYYPMREIDKVLMAVAEHGADALDALQAALDAQPQSDRLAQRLRIARHRYGV